MAGWLSELPVLSIVVLHLQCTAAGRRQKVTEEETKQPLLAIDNDHPAMPGERAWLRLRMHAVHTRACRDSIESYLKGA
jgi:hypothetical protein